MRKATLATLSATFRHWLGGVRLYIAVGILLVTLQVWWWANSAFAGDPGLIASRSHEAFGWLSVSLLILTLMVGPAYRLAPQLPGKYLMRDARRLLGLGAAWFAILHTGIAYFVSFQAVSLLEVSAVYRQAFVVGGIALIILILMAATSFDAAIKRLGTWWLRLHRLAYVALALAIWHALMIGVHASSLQALALLVGACLLLIISHVNVAMQQPKKITEWQIITLVAAFTVLVVLSNYGIQLYVEQNSLQGHSQ